MDIIFLLSGTRGDIQPFLAFIQRLQESGHRIRVVADKHAKDILHLKDGLSFYPVEGDQVATIKDWVKSRGKMGQLTLENIRSPEVKRAQNQILLQAGSFWDACIEPWERTTNIKTEGRSQTGHEDLENTQKEYRPFIPDAIISNNQADMAIHCAEKLGLPLLQLSTFPWHPTKEFPFMLSSPEDTNFTPSLANLLSHKKGRFIRDLGIFSLLNQVRTNCLGLKPLSILWGSGQFSRMKIPEANFWSPLVIDKPKEWGSHISVVGYSFPDSKVEYTPLESLLQFLEEGDQPIYIGFGSCTEDSQHLTNVITQAVHNAGIRAIISRGWAKLGNNISGDQSVYVVDDIPHSFLFSRVRAIIQHGGAGTTAAGFKAGKPMLVIPFVADMTFWGMLVQKHGIGPMPIHRDQLTTENLTAGIKDLLRPAHLRRAEDMARKLAFEPDGAETAVRIFNQMVDDNHKNERMCDFLSDQRATWRVRSDNRMGAHLSSLTACVLVQEHRLAWSDLHRTQDVHYRWIGPNSGALGVLRLFLLLVYWIFNALLITIKSVFRPMSWGVDAKRRQILKAKIEDQLREARISQGGFDYGALEGEERELLKETVLHSWDKFEER